MNGGLRIRLGEGKQGQTAPGEAHQGQVNKPQNDIARVVLSMICKCF